MTSLSWVDSRGPLRSLVSRESPASLHETKKVSSFFFHIRLYRFFFFLRFIFEMPFLLTDALLPFPLSLLSEGHHISSTPLCVFAVAAITAYCSFYYYHYCVWMCVLCSSVSSLSPLIRGRSSFPFFFLFNGPVRKREGKHRASIHLRCLHGLKLVTMTEAFFFPLAQQRRVPHLQHPQELGRERQRRRRCGAAGVFSGGGGEARG